MHGDYTRMTFKPSKDHAGVLMQQGRVTLDADWNELVELIDRRFRAETIDALGRCYVSKETPSAFAIAFAGGTLTIGTGRAYVHGLLAENHGGDPAEYDPVLGEVRGTAAVKYEDQPYLLDAADVAPLPKTGTYVAYLDVWERDLTYLQDPDLVEKAIAVDTATRLQTAWQVRLLEAPEGTACDSQLPAWDALTAPSAGRLNTQGVGVPAATDPCTIPASGGYRGTENRLYRVEIHEAGPLGTATFKWSRDEASIGARVKSIDTATRTKVGVDRLGRDSVRRIRVDDWVEVTDDVREFAGLPGELRKVTAVDEVSETLTLGAALPSGAFDPTDADRHTRVIRWDQSGAAVDAAAGVVGVPSGGTGSPIVLEDGVEIRFGVDPTGGDFHVGDNWVFAARTADASVEELVDEPPRGVKHHFCRLAVVTFPDVVVDCRTPPAEEDHGCDCTVCVTPESHASGALTIQKAIDMVAPVGGKVCLQAGFYPLRESIRIRAARSLHLQGKGWMTVLVAAAGFPAIIVETSIGVTIDSLAVVTSTASTQGAIPTGIAIGLRNTIGTVVERCVLAQLSALGGRVAEANRASVNEGHGDAIAAALGPRGAGAPLIVLDGIVAETLVQENVLLGTVGIGLLSVDPRASLADRRAMDVGVVEREVSSRAEIPLATRGYLLSFDLAVEENLFICSLGGVALEGFSLQLGETRLAHNSVLGCLRAGITSLGMLGPLGRIDVLHNLVRVFGTGIAVGTDDTRVADNDVGSLVASRDQLGGVLTAGVTDVAVVQWSLGAGIALAPGLGPAGIDRCIVTGNRVVRVLGDGIAIRAPIVSTTVAHNVVQATGGNGIAMEEGGIADLLTIESNQVLDVALLSATFKDRPAAGILLASTQNAAVLANTVAGVAASDPDIRLRMGILIRSCATARVTGNDVSGVGPEDEFLGVALGIGIGSAFQQADVTDNVVRRGTGQSDDPHSLWTGILVAGGTTKTDAVPKQAQTLMNALVVSNVLYLVGASSGKIVRLPRGRGSAGLHGNVVEAYGEASAVIVETPASCIFSDNRCFLAAPRDEPVAKIFAGALVASANYLEGPGKGASFAISLPAAAGFTVLGNVASGPIQVNGAALAAPWNQLNVF